jgi:hypothetical protein
MSNTTLTILSIIFASFCVIGYLAPKVLKDEDTLYGFNAVLISFLVGFIVCGVIVFFIN